MNMYSKISLFVLFISSLILVLLNIEKLELLIQNGKLTQANKTLDLTQHPLYKNYQFGGDKVIDIGIQPLYSISSILEVMKRDKLLKQALAEQGLEVRFHSFLKGKDLNFFLERGDLDAGMAGDMPALTLCAKKSIVITSLIEQGFASIISNSVTLFSDLKGKKIAYAEGSNAYRVLLYLLAAYDLTEKDVQLIPLDVTQMPDALEKGDIDAFSAWEPTPTISLLKHPDTDIAVAKGLIYAYLYFDKSFAAKHRLAIKHIIASQIRSMKWLRQSPENLLSSSRWAIQEGIKMGGDFSSLPEKKFLLLTKNSILRTLSIGQLPQMDLQEQGVLIEQFRFLQNIGKLPATVSSEQMKACFDVSVFDETLSEAQQFQLNTFSVAQERR